MYLNAFIAWPCYQVSIFHSHRYEDRRAFGKWRQFHHKSDNGSVRSQSQTCSANLVTRSNLYAAYPRFVPFVTLGTRPLPYLLDAIVNSPIGCCHRKALRRLVLNRGLGAPRPRPERTSHPNGAAKKNSSKVDITIIPDPSVVVRI